MVSFQVLVLAAALAGSNNDLVLLDFGADWCAPCRSMEPTLQRLEDAGYPIRRVDVEREPELARRYGIGPIPCFVLVQNGREIQRVVGATSFEQLAQLFQQAHSGNTTWAADSEVPHGNVRAQSPDQMATRPMPPAPAHPMPTDVRPQAGNYDAARGQAPPPTAATTSVPTDRLTRAHQLALQATVLLRVTDATGQSKGTGTIIDVHGNEALVATCGHIFRESQGKGDIEVELFAPGAQTPVPGHLLLYECDQRDFGLVSIRLSTPVTPVQVASNRYHPRPGEPIFSVGCNHGRDPTVRVSTISAIDRYVGHPNIEIHGHPVEGRSGGGLFTEDGQIIGICNAADLQDDRGIYASLPTLHLALDRIGQREIYTRQSPPPATLADDYARPPAPAPLDRQVAPQPSAPIHPVSRNVAAPSAMEREVICVVRAADGTTRTIVVRNPSAELLQSLSSEAELRAEAPSSAAPPPQHEEIARLSQLPGPRSGPIIRAQNH